MDPVTIVTVLNTDAIAPLPTLLVPTLVINASTPQLPFVQDLAGGTTQTPLNTFVQIMVYAEHSFRKAE